MYLDQGEIREGVQPYSFPVVIRACALGVGTQLGVPHPLEVSEIFYDQEEVTPLYEEVSWLQRHVLTWKRIRSTLRE